MSEVADIPAGFINVADVVKAQLCCFCGACEGLCPQRAIALDWSESFPKPVVDDKKCTKCKLCVYVCPGHGINFDELNKYFFDHIPDNRILGHYISCGVGAVTDPENRYNRTSGGLAKEIANWGLQENLWQAAVVSRFCRGTYLQTETVLAETPQEVESAASSLYCPVPACKSFSALRDYAGKVCFIGLPCHLHALRKAQKNLPWLGEKVVFAIGLFCSILTLARLSHLSIVLKVGRAK